MRNPLRILSIEDDPQDSRLIQDLLEAEDIVCEVTRIDTQAALLASFEQGGIDLILADYSLPSFDGISALRLAMKACPEVPFIFVSGTLGEEVAIEALKIGATDYVLKTRLSRLVPSVQRALREAEERAERKQADEKLRRSEAYLTEAQRLSQTGSWAWSPDHDIRYWSEECYRVLSFDPRDGLPRFEEFFQRIHPDDQPGFREIIQTAIREKAEWEADYRIVHLNGSARDIHAVGHPVLSTSGHLVEFVGTVIDITERRRAERERARLRQLEADLAHMNRVSMMGVLAASLAHEVKQPIASARTNARAALNFLAKRPPDLGEVREALGCIVGDADRAGDIIDRIRAHSKKAPLRKVRFDLNKAVTEVVELARSAITKHGVSLQMRLAEESFAVEGDRVQLQQVILNLILNAIEAMSSINGPRELVIGTEQRQTNGLVSVRDSGPGIDAEARERVFEAFYTTKSDGVGIGLSICRSIIDAHGGRLSIEANEPRGAAFQFTVPSTASELRSIPQPLHQAREPHEDSVADATNQTGAGV